MILSLPPAGKERHCKGVEVLWVRPISGTGIRDGNNDVEMFQAVGTGVAMENASEKLKAAATDHCGHVAEDGIYYYCVEHGLI